VESKNSVVNKSKESSVVIIYLSRISQLESSIPGPSFLKFSTSEAITNLINLGWVGLTVCQSKKEDWLPKKERNQRTPGCRRSQEEFDGNWRAPPQGPVPSGHLQTTVWDMYFFLLASEGFASFLMDTVGFMRLFYWMMSTFFQLWISNLRD